MKPRKSLTIIVASCCAALLIARINPCFAGTSVVGPKPWRVVETVEKVGYLKVFSKTEERISGDQTYSYPHTGYAIYDASGKRRHWIRNGDVNQEQPEKVSLPDGKYVIWAQSDAEGWVHIPVLIKTGLTTNLYLEQSDQKFASNAMVVRLPGGSVIGYAAD